MYALSSQPNHSIPGHFYNDRTIDYQFSTPLIQNKGFIIDTEDPRVHYHSLEIEGLANVNGEVVFNCIERMDSNHLARFIEKYPESLHKRLCLYFIRSMAKEMNVDDINECLIKPTLQILYPSQMPNWIGELSSHCILETLATIQKSIGGSENLQNEFSLFQQKLSAFVDELSAMTFRNFIEQNPSITDVYGFTNQHFLGFLDTGKSVQLDIDQNHLLYNCGNRSVSVHLYGNNDKSSFRKGMIKFIHNSGLKSPPGYLEMEPESTLEGSDKICRAAEHLRIWWNKHEHLGTREEELLSWLHEDKNALLIQTYKEFTKLINYLNYYSFSKQIEKELGTIQTPNQQCFDSALKLRNIRKKSGGNSITSLIGVPKTIHDFWIFLLSKYKKRNTNFSHEFTKPYSLKKFDMNMARAELDNFLYSSTPNLLDLLPSSSNSLAPAELSSNLKKYLDLIKLAQQALDKFSKREMDFFDPIAGENACQIRALIFCEILRLPNIDDKIIEAQQQLSSHSQKISSLLQVIHEKVENLSLKDWIKKNCDALILSEEFVILIASYILTESKIRVYEPNHFGVPVLSQMLSSNVMSTRKNLTKKFAADLIKCAQRKLSELSVVYVQRIALNLLFSKDEKASALLTFNHKKWDQFHRARIPFFPTMRLLINQLRAKKIPLILKINQFTTGQSESYGKLTLMFEGSIKGALILSSKPAELLKKGAVYFSAKSITSDRQSKESLKEKILIHSVENYILSASADHPHFECKDSELNGTDIEEYRKKAHEIGACYANPSVFMVQHVRCKTIEQKLIEELN